jgi:hypothetical protein
VETTEESLEVSQINILSDKKLGKKIRKGIRYGVCSMEEIHEYRVNK